MDFAAFQLLRLASPALPIGAYSYSQGMESAIEHGIAKDAASARIWIADQLQGPLGNWEAPLLWQCLQAAHSADWSHLDALNQRWLASRETRERRRANRARARGTERGVALGDALREALQDHDRHHPA